MSDPARLTDQQIDPDECPACEACEHSLVKAERRLEVCEEQLEAERATSERLEHERDERIPREVSLAQQEALVAERATSEGLREALTHYAQHYGLTGKVARRALEDLDA